MTHKTKFLIFFNFWTLPVISFEIKASIRNRKDDFNFFCHIFFSENAAISGGRLAYFQYWSAMYNVRKKCHLLEQILCPTSQHEFLVYFHIQLGTLWLQLPSACCSPWVRTLKTWNIKIYVNKGVEYCHKLKFVIPISLQPGGVNI